MFCFFSTKDLYTAIQNITSKVATSTKPDQYPLSARLEANEGGMLKRPCGCPAIKHPSGCPVAIPRDWFRLACMIYLC